MTTSSSRTPSCSWATHQSAIDLLTIDGVNFDECHANRVEFELPSGTHVPFISLEDLRANKRATGRLQDLADLEALEDSTAWARGAVADGDTIRPESRATLVDLDARLGDLPRVAHPWIAEGNVA